MLENLCKSSKNLSVQVSFSFEGNSVRRQRILAESVTKAVKKYYHKCGTTAAVRASLKVGQLSGRVCGFVGVSANGKKNRGYKKLTAARPIIYGPGTYITVPQGIEA